MLKEFAFTPQVFDPTADPSNLRWRECIRAIVLRLFTLPAAPVVVSALHSDGANSTWERMTTATIEAINDPSLRQDAQALFTQIAKVLVGRPPCCDWPGEEELAWGKEAADSHAIEPLHQIVAQSVANVPAPAPASALKDALSPAFWTSLQQDLSTPTSLKEDVARLRSLLVHSNHVVLTAPYVNTTEFAIECIRQAVRRPAGFPVPIVHVHQALADGANQVTRIAWIRRQLGDIAGRSIVHWWWWPELHSYRERIVLAGRLADLGGGMTKFAARSGVAMTHVWGEGDPAHAEPSTCTLLSASQAKRHADAINDRAAKLKLGSIPI